MPESISKEVVHRRDSDFRGADAVEMQARCEAERPGLGIVHGNVCVYVSEGIREAPCVELGKQR